MMIGIEYVCTGNNGRSPMAEAIALDYLQRNALESKVFARSSGSGHHPLFAKTGEALRKLQRDVVTLALKNDLYAKDVAEEARQALQSSLGGDINHFYGLCIKVEETFRNLALFNVGLLFSGQQHKLTIPDPATNLILTMSLTNTEQVRKIYEDSEFTPKIISLKEYLGLEGEVANPFCHPLPAYERCRDELLLLVPQSIDKAIEEYDLLQ